MKRPQKPYNPPAAIRFQYISSNSIYIIIKLIKKTIQFFFLPKENLKNYVKKEKKRLKKKQKLLKKN